jgi:hypothetical protein
MSQDQPSPPSLSSKKRRKRRWLGKHEYEWGSTHVELLDGRSATFVGGNFLDLHDLDGVSAGTMTGTHVAVLRKRRTRIKNTNMAAGHVYQQELFT